MKKHVLLIFLLAVCTGSVLCQNAAKDSMTYYQRHLYLPVTIKDTVKGNFIFDTGATMFFPDSLFFVRHFPEMKTGKAAVRGVGKTVAIVPMIMEPLAFEFASGHYKSSLSPLLSLKQILGRQADGIVGMDYLKGRYIEIDYLHGRFRTTDHPDTAGYRRLPLSYRDGKLHVKMAVTIAGKTLEGWFVLDTGNGGAADISYPTALKYGLQTAPGQQSEYRNLNGGVGGESRYVRRIAEEIRLDTFRLKGPAVSYSLDKSGSLASDDRLGLVGNILLSRFDLMIDLKGMALFLRPNADYAKPFENRGHGIVYVDRTDVCDGFIVNGMRRGANAEKAGLRERDIIISIDGTPVKKLTPEQADSLLSDISKPPVVLTVLRNGKNLKIDFAPELSL